MKWRSSAFFFKPAEMTTNDLDHFLGILEHLPILESDHFDSEVVKILLPLAVFLFGLLIEMDMAIEFDGESLRRTIEIENVGPYAVLSTKLSSVNSNL